VNTTSLLEDAANASLSGPELLSLLEGRGFVGAQAIVTGLGLFLTGTEWRAVTSLSSTRHRHAQTLAPNAVAVAVVTTVELPAAALSFLSERIRSFRRRGWIVKPFAMPHGRVLVAFEWSYKVGPTRVLRDLQEEETS
jgi:hypothetical protein